VDPGEERVTVYMLASVGPRGSTILVYQLNTSIVPDDYPADKLEPGVVADTMSLVAKRYGLEPNPALGTVAEWYGSYYSLTMPSLNEVPHRPAPLDVAYSPVFRREWAGYLAGYAGMLVEEYYRDAIGRGSFWILVGHNSTHMLLRLSAAPVRFNLDVEESGGRLVLTVESAAIADPRADVSLLLYRRGESRPCAGVAPPGYQYNGIPYINAEEWSGGKGRAYIVVDVAKLRGLAGRCGGGDVRLAVWIGDSMVYLAPIP